ncbi:hypothetical protein [uncultured Tenacibaculum sp.]|uniref:hypothetical protein n=1 Tax=uncultured Tenacibaculum sp. TaxID=174713 RepID=UPI002624E988|nr:hypothetical protein [uncultured Tenacibaculum sp.]
MFKKESSPSEKKKELEGLFKGKLSFLKKSNYELSQVKRRIRLKIKEEEKKLKIYFSLILIVLALISIPLLIQFRDAQKEINQRNIAIKKEAYNKKYLPKFNFVIEDGDQWLAKKKYKNAIYQYNKALEYFPKSSLAKEKLIFAYQERCKNVNIDCDKLN